MKLRGILLGLGLIPVLFYTYNGVIGKSPDWINIAIFFVSAAMAYLFETRMLITGNPSCSSPKTAQGILIVIAVLFILFTFVTPKLGMFRDPLTGTYGITQAVSLQDAGQTYLQRQSDPRHQEPHGADRQTVRFYAVPG